jgi:hypothetical protein
MFRWDVACFFAGAFLANFVPHFVHGISGDRFPTPFANPPGKGLSSPTLNVSKLPHSEKTVPRALCLGLSLKSRTALPRMRLGHNVKIANITDLSELEVGNPENDN